MSSFKRRPRGPTPSGSAPTSLALPAGVKPSSFSSPVPLVSTGVPALDDLLSGGGLSSSSSLLIIPASGTASQSAAQLGASGSTPTATAQTDHAARAAAQPYTELLLGYSIAQGIASGHNGVVIGEDVGGLVSGLMARAGEADEELLKQLGPLKVAIEKEEEVGPSDSLDTVTDEDEIEGEGKDSGAGVDAETPEQREREMKIAWRYSNMKQFNTTVNEPSSSSSSSNEPAPFCQTFDLSKRMDSRIIQHSIDLGKLETVDIGALSSGSRAVNSYELAYKHIEAAASRCRAQLSSSSTTPVLRIAIRALGSPAWTVPRNTSAHTEIIRFLHRLKRLLRSLSLTDSSSRIPAIPSIATITISSFLSSTFANLIHRIVHTVDSAVSMSAFASSPALRSAFSAYTGAFKVLKTPSVGTLTNPSIRSSVLRGMGVGAGGKTGSGEGGAGGGENNLAFKVRRKRLVIETLHLDVEGGVSERRTKPPKGLAGTAVGGGEKKAAKTAVPEAKSDDKSTTGLSFVRKQQSAPDAPSAGTGQKKFGGLSSLRQRGLAAAAAAGGSGQGASQQREYQVEVDSAPHKHPHSHQSRPAQSTNRVANTRAEDLEF